VNATQRGYLLLADISGYTSYVASTELTHSQEILSELLELIVGRFKVWMTIHKLEGDAVFAYTPESKIERGETLFELIESTYVAFRNKREAAQRRTTCTCNACRNIPNLDLKFIAHYGEYFVQDVMGTKELVGSDVNLIHRLLKNRVSESTGWQAYALFTETSLQRLGLHPEGFHEGVESYEHLGDVRTLSMDLHARYQELMDARHAVVTSQEAHHIFEWDYNAPPEVVWEWFNDPHKRGQWMTSEIVPILRIHGRSGAGARNHCVHGKNQVIVEDVLDMRPYQYFTVKHTPQGLPTSLKMTFSFEPINSNRTHFRLLFQAHVPYAPEWLKKRFCLYILRTQVFTVWKLESIDDLMKQEGRMEAINHTSA
jgi:uncharacterized protein YndB with AHSA1/START domain